MTDEAKALVEQISDEADLCRNDGAGDIADLLDETKALIETQAREIERLREALENIMALEDDFESNAAMTAHEWQMFRAARAALAGDSHDQ